LLASPPLPYDIPVPRTRIKICGITRPQDAQAAAHAGADAIGLVFYPVAKRCVSSELLHVLPAFVTPVALFVDQDVAEMKQIAGALGIRHIQLHGHENPAIVAALRDFTVIKAVRAARQTLGPELDFWRESMDSLDLANLQGFVFETPGTGAGGTGVENDWNAIAELQQTGAFAGLPPVIAAGGLDPGNVQAVIERLHPYAVDVSSGVEETFGEKSPAKLAGFMKAVAAAR
jgi:phosphoribosylanthranilate isomerase